GRLARARGRPALDPDPAGTVHRDRSDERHQPPAAHMSEPHDVEVLAEEIRKLREELKLRPIRRQATVLSVDPGPPQVLTVLLGEGTVGGVRCFPGYTAVEGDAVWLDVSPGGVRIALGDLP